MNDEHEPPPLSTVERTNRVAQATRISVIGACASLFLTIFSAIAAAILLVFSHGLLGWAIWCGIHA